MSKKDKSKRALLIANLSFHAAPDASMDDGLLDISVYPDFSKGELATYFGKRKNEGQTSDGTIQRYRSSEGNQVAGG